MSGSTNSNGDSTKGLNTNPKPIPPEIMAEDFKLLKEMTEISACSGFETPITIYLQNLLQDVCDEMEVDMLGNLICTIKGKPGEKTVYIDAHIDEIGFQVVYIEKEGFIRVADVGGQNPRILPGSRVIIHSARGGDLLGVFGEKPIHLLNQEQRKKTSEVNELYIDIGLKSKEEVEKWIDVGDFITLNQTTERFYNSNIVTGKAFDDRAGALLLVRALQWIKQNGRVAFNVVAGFVSQEELGSRGSITAAYKCNPDIAIVLEVNHSMDFPGAPKSERGDVGLGKGAIIPIGPNIHPLISRMILQVAKDNKIPVQPVALPKLASNDAREIQVARNGIPTGLITLPLRYMHTSIETIDLQDLYTSSQLLYEVIKKLE